ncbi:MAG: hypothetical protein AAF583_02665 [Pseudomonadota bacterium]
MSNTPVKKFRLGRITATVWNNPADDGSSRYSCSVVRNYKDKEDKWQETSSFFPEDLPIVARLSDRALNHIMILQERLDQPLQRQEAA